MHSIPDIRYLDMWYSAYGIYLGEIIPDTSKEVAEDEEDKKDSEEGRNEEVEKEEKDDPSVGTQYQLRGILVHSGQASGGHYYSFMHVRCVTPPSYPPF